ncbi:hypothetical protein OPQ81_004783 [Rhizoctonia solani]|nr:hypothetical protein OPQ81_004783 [Rhizoctonia solani]
MRGLRSGLAATGTGSLIPNDTFGEAGNGSISGSGQPDVQNQADNVLEHQLQWTDKSLLVATDNVGSGSRVIRRGRLTAVAAILPTHNSVRDSSLQESGPVDGETLKPASVSQPTSAATTQDIQEYAATKSAAYEEGTRKELIRVQSRRSFPGNLSIATPKRPPRVRTLSMYGSQTGLIHAFKTPLQATLYDSSHQPLATPPVLPTQSTLFILAVGVAYADLKDPHHDLDILEMLFNGQEPDKTYFKGISGEEATLEGIEKALRELYREAVKSPGSNLLIILTGEGDKYNRMHLMGGVFITHQDLRRWIWKLQIDYYPDNRTVTIILDYCRMNPDVPLGMSHAGVELIWSCSPGQFAAGLRFPNKEGIPRSCFLLALMMVSYSIRNQSDLNLTMAINYELRRLLRLLELTYKKIHDAGRCTPCSAGEPCPIPPPGSQDPDWQQAGSMKSVYSVVEALSKMDIVSEVYRLFMGNKTFCEANKLPLDRATFEPTLSHRTGMTQHNRGSSKPIYAAPGVPR